MHLVKNDNDDDYGDDYGVGVAVGGKKGPQCLSMADQQCATLLATYNYWTFVASTFTTLGEENAVIL